MAAFVLSSPGALIAPGVWPQRRASSCGRGAAAPLRTTPSSRLHLRAANAFVGRPPAADAPAPVPPLPAAATVSMEAAAAPAAAPTAAPPVPAKIIIAGAPASGKGTQCEMLTAAYGCVHLSTGDMLRAAVAAGTPLGKSAAAAMDAGKLVPDDVVIGMIVERLRDDDVAARGWLLDGFPRTGAQAAALAEAGVVPNAVLKLNVGVDTLVRRVTGRRSDPETGKVYHLEFAPPPNDEVAARLICRSDDTAEKVRVRVAAFEEHASAIAGQYPNMVQVDGERPVDVVAADIKGVVDAALADAAAAEAARGAAEDGAATVSGGGGGGVNEFVRYAEEAYDSGILTNDKVNWSGQAGVDVATTPAPPSYADLAAHPLLALGDTAVFLTFAAIGAASHASAATPVTIAITAAPFIVTWLAVAPLVGAYSPRAVGTYQGAAVTTARGWLVGVPSGLALRGVLTSHLPPPAFAVVTLLSTAVLLGVWRGVYVKVRGVEGTEGKRASLLDGFRMITTLLRRW
ncbi:hypothetical protein MMPV_001046 [Pyropia vietnamensis]